MQQRLAIATLALIASTTSAFAQFADPLPSALCAGWRGERVCELLNEDAQVRILRCTFPPGIGHEPHYHPPHFGIVLEGESVMRTTTADRVRDFHMRPGASFSNDTEVRHAALNIGKRTMVYLIVEKKYADARPASAVAPGLCAGSP
ncbi:MAG: cupin domain-containing protein [Hyphomonadaceae bacterium]|nr:cupin domain-containing protein [Hyphomonadaceae bacterium]